MRFANRPWIPVTLSYVALTLVLSYPLPLHLSSRMLAAGADPQFWLWTLAWDTHAFTHQPWAIFDANIFYPGQHTLAYSENLIGSAMLAAPIIWLFGNPVLALNLVELSTIILSAMGAFLLARRVGLRLSAAWLAGLIFAFAPARFLRMTQFHLTTIQWVPFALAFLYSYLHGGRKTDLRWFILFASLQSITSGHGVVFLVLASAVLIVHRLLQGEPIALGRRVRDVGVPGALLLVPPAWVFRAYQSAKADVPALARTLDDYGVSLASYFASPSHLQQWVLSHAHVWMTTPEADAYLFPGYLPVLLSLIAVGWTTTRAREAAPGRARRWWAHVGVLMECVVLFVCAVGAYVAWTSATRLSAFGVTLVSTRHVWRIWALAAVAVALRAAITARAPVNAVARARRAVARVAWWWDARRRDAATPFALLTLVAFWLTLGPPIGLWRWVYWLPAFSFLRVPSRFVMVEMLGLAILGAFGFERLTAGMRSRTRAFAAMAVAALLVAEFAAMPLATEPFRVSPPPIDHWMNTLPKPFVVAEVPMPRTWSPAVVASFNANYMLHSTAHWQKTVHGFSGAEPPLHTQLFLEMSRFPDDLSVHRLADLGVTYIVMHTDLYRGNEQADAEAKLTKYADWLTLVHVEGAGRVYRLRRPPSPGQPPAPAKPLY